MEGTGTASAVASAPSAPASSGGSSAPTEQAFAAALASGDSPAPQTPADTSDAAAAAQPDATQETPQQQDERSPFIPRQRFDEVNNALKELKAWKEQRAWADSVNPQEFAQVQQIARHFANGDKFSGFKALLAEAQKDDPQFAAQLRSEAARILSQRQQSQPAQVDLTPIQVQLENGQTQGLYGAEQVKALVEQAVAGVRQELQPLQQSLKQQEAARAVAEQQQQISHFVTTTFEDLKTWPGMDSSENQKAVAQALGQMAIDPNDPKEVSLALNAAWRRVVGPTLGRQAEAKLLDSLKNKAMASTGVNPGSAAPSASRAVTKFADLPADAWR